MAERVLTPRELNRATLARQLLLERTRLSPTAVIERLVGMQAQSPQAPYVGIWTRTTGFRRGSLERLLQRYAVVRGTATRQTLHLVTPRDYALIWAAMSETSFPWESKEAKRLALSARALAAERPVTSAEAIAELEGEHGADARRVWRMARAAALVAHHHERALWQSSNDGRFVAIDEPQPHVPVEARAELLRRYLAAFGPSTRRDIAAWSRLRMSAIDAALQLLEPLRRFRDEQGRELFDVPRAPLPDAETPAPVRFLPKWDNVLLAWDDRTRVLPDAYRRTREEAERRRRADVPGRRRRRRDLARRRRPRRAGAVRAAVSRCAARARGRGRASGGVPLGAVVTAVRLDPSGHAQRMRIFNLNSDEWDGTRDRQGWRAKGASVGERIGGELIGASMSEVEPGDKLWRTTRTT